MLFRRCQITPIVDRAAFVHQLSDEEMQYAGIDITHVGAVDNIKFVKKEDTLMVEKLKAYLAELVDKKTALESPLDISEIDVKVADYRAQLIADAEALRKAEVAKVNSDIECINNIIVREEEAAAVVASMPTEIAE